MKKELKHYLGIILLINLLSSCKDEFMQGYRDVNMLHFDVSLIRPETSKGIPINSASDTAFTDFGIFVYETSDEFIWKQFQVLFPMIILIIRKSTN